MIGSLFSGSGALDLAVRQAFDAKVAWHCENDPDASRTIARHWPGTPNLGDVTQIDWNRYDSAKYAPIDILTGGYPCQPFSLSGKRNGLNDDRNLWPHFAAAIRHLRPSIVILENVAGHRSMGFGRVLGDLAEIGYDTQWCSVRASDVGAPHKRERVFVIAHPPGGGRHEGWTESARLVGGSDAAASSDASVDLLPTPKASDGSGGGQHPDKRAGHSRQLIDYALLLRSGWGKYGAAIRRWETLTRPAPSPTELNTKGNPRLSTAFPEWMMGWPEGWVTKIPGISRSSQLRIIGNGVVPQQALSAINQLLNIKELIGKPNDRKTCTAVVAPRSTLGPRAETG